MSKFLEDLNAGKLRKVDLTGMDFTRRNEERIALMKTEGFDRLNDEMYIATFADRIQDGDEVYAYKDIGPLSGSAGYILVRDGKVIAQQISMKS